MSELDDLIEEQARLTEELLATEDMEVARRLQDVCHRLTPLLAAEIEAAQNAQ